MFKLFLILAILSQASGPAGRGSLEGQIFDPSSAIVRDAYIQVRHLGNGAEFQAVSDAQGRYRLLNLPAGRYRVFAEAPGFEDFEIDDLKIEAGASRTLTIRMKLAHLTTEVTVTATPQEGIAQTHNDHIHETLEIHEVRESSAKDVGEALMRLDGVHKIRKAGIASDIVVRGFQQDNLNVTIDGTRIYGACPNNMDPPAFHVDFSEVAKVEVSKGPFDMRNQGGLGGAINIVNKTPQSGFHVSPNLSTGSFGFFNPSLTASLSKGKLHGLAGHSFRRSGPYEDGVGKRITEYANYRPDALDKEAFHIHTSWFKFGADINARQKVDFGYTRQQGGEVSYPYLLMDALYDNADRLNAAYRVSDPFPMVDTIRVQGYFTQVKHWMTDQYRVSSTGAPRNYGMATFAGTRAIGSHIDAEMGAFVTGAEFYVRDWNAITTLRSAATYTHQASLPDVRMTTIGVYGEYTRALIPRLRLTLGARLDTGLSDAKSANVNTDIFFAYKNTRDTSRRDTLPSGSVRLAYTFQNFELFGGLGHASRFPDPQERYFGLQRMGTDWVGNPNLDPTRNTEADFGFTIRNDRFILRPTLFYSDLDNFIVVHNQKLVNPLPSIKNVISRSYAGADAKIYGGELMWSAAVTDSLIVRSGVSYSRGSKAIDPSLMIFDPDLAEMAPVKLRAVVRYGQRRFFTELEGLAIGRQERVDSDVKENTTPGYAILNAKFGLRGERLEMTVGLDNLFDRYYFEHFSFQRDPFRTGTRIPEPGRSAFLTISYGF